MDEQNKRMLSPQPAQSSPVTPDYQPAVSRPSAKIGKTGFVLALLPGVSLLFQILLQPG